MNEEEFKDIIDSQTEVDKLTIGIDVANTGSSSVAFSWTDGTNPEDAANYTTSTYVPSVTGDIQIDPNIIGASTVGTSGFYSYGVPDFTYELPASKQDIENLSKALLQMMQEIGELRNEIKELKKCQ